VNLRKFFGLCSGLAGTDRFSNANLIHRESVLEHTGQVVLCCYMICIEIDASDAVMGSVLAKAAVHDVEETLTGDIPRNVKHANFATMDAFHALQENAMSQIADSLELDESCYDIFVEDHHFAKTGKEGMILELADVLAVVYKVHHEAIERGNRCMLSRASSCRSHLVAMENKFRDSDKFSDIEKFNSKEIHSIMSLIRQAKKVLDEAERLASTAQISEAAE
jgi:5'-deoxynucleotidase YfbR-like HD superfamily hydrolase